MFRKQIWPVTVAGMMLLVAVGCSESQNPIQQYGNEVIQAGERTKRLRARADMQALKTGIQQYYIEQGRFPASLSDLPIVQYQDLDPDLYAYDPSTGSIHLQ
ncbi:MAG: hypothetical protein V3R58_08565 [candidate division NC10 bacterium]|jgi:hypothetical protein